MNTQYHPKGRINENEYKEQITSVANDSPAFGYKR